MIKNIYTRWILGGIALLIIIAGGCYLWYQHSLADERKAAADAQKLLRQSEIEKSEKSNVAEQAADAPAESSTPTVEKPVNKGTAKVDNDTESGGTTEAPTQTAETAEVRVSKFGFGPYPEIPPDFPWQDLFDPPYYADDPNHLHKDDPDYELMYRLRVELWKRGERGVEGFGKLNSTGLFYPTIRGTIYVEWAPRWKVFGKGFGRTIRYIDGHPDDLKRLRSVDRESEIPSDIKVLDISEGIDAYEFLDLPRP